MWLFLGGNRHWRGREIRRSQRKVRISNQTIITIWKYRCMEISWWLLWYYLSQIYFFKACVCAFFKPFTLFHCGKPMEVDNRKWKGLMSVWWVWQPSLGKKMFSRPARGKLPNKHLEGCLLKMWTNLETMWNCCCFCTIHFRANTLATWMPKVRESKFVHITRGFSFTR